MSVNLTSDMLVTAGLDATTAGEIVTRLGAIRSTDAAELWSRLSRDILTPDLPFAVHTLFYDTIFAGWDERRGPRPAWTPSPMEISDTNAAAFCRSAGIAVSDLHRWSIDKRADFWRLVIETLGIRFATPPQSVMAGDAETPRWLAGAELNIADSCFQSHPDSAAVVYQRDGAVVETMTCGELDTLSNRVANSCRALGLDPGDSIAIAMPMTVEAVAAYLGIVKAGCCVVSIADSFAAEEIATRIRLSKASAIITQDVVHRSDKTLPMYQKVVDANAPRAVVIPAGDGLAMPLRPEDAEWSAFLVDDTRFESVPRQPADTANILFSSGTTGDPKAIPWTHTTPVKCAMDGYLHHDIKPGNVVAWPTNLGWMMGPWLIFASLVNRATIALYYGAPNTPGFCRFVEDAKVGMLGVVPSLVKAWRTGGACDGVDWSSINAYSSTGEASNSEDMLWLMSRAGYRPVIEYCGGTEIGGGYITGSMAQPQSPATFSTPANGLDVVILDEDGAPADAGELFIVPPSIGLSEHLLNKDHYEVYYADTPPGPKGGLLRRHGDQMERLGGGYYRAHGRADDTMNLGGIKVSSAEIERVLAGIPGITETAAIAVSPAEGGPSRLVIYAVLDRGTAGATGDLARAMQSAITQHLNPLFRVHDVVVIDALPRTASNKVMRRVLRSRYGRG